MREIKFRKWVPEEYGEPGYMISGDDLAFDEYLPLTDLLRQEGIMQYIGLKDKNGKEIYEGDILGGVIGGTVVWVKDEARFGIDILGDTSETKFDEWKSYDLEVIGNIYDNPELLEATK